MKPLTGKELARELEKRGWQLLRIHGSHHIYGMPGVEARISIPIDGNKPLKVGLAKHALKIAGIDGADL